VAKQIAAALSDEVAGLQNVGIRIIQVDEAAFREGYPLRSAHIGDYETWAVDAFKLAVSTADKETQIHTHMCYSDFTDSIKTIEANDDPRGTSVMGVCIEGVIANTGTAEYLQV
jgi:5-methyltetrahydropteroyltriglutamate--homocysteine methyltransferase